MHFAIYLPEAPDESSMAVPVLDHLDLWVRSNCLAEQPAPQPERLCHKVGPRREVKWLKTAGLSNAETQGAGPPHNASRKASPQLVAPCQERHGAGDDEPQRDSLSVTSNT